MLTDSHCHLDFPDYQNCLPEVLQTMSDAGVHRAICISTQLETFPNVLALATQNKALWATVGVHPDYEAIAEPSVTQLMDLARSSSKIVGIGETGLDYYRLEGRSLADMQWQRDRFVVHIEAARQLDLPLVVHTRMAADDTLKLLQTHGFDASSLPDVTGVFHCFTESKEIAKRVLDRGFYISFSGIVTFKNAKQLHEVAAYVPLDRLLIETDSPYLAPTPHRGKTNHPAWVVEVARYLAQLRNIPLATIEEATEQNIHRLFKRMA